MEEGGQGGGRKAAARPPLLLSARRSAPSGAQTTAAASHAARAGAGLRGWGRARAGACSHTPSMRPRRPGDAATWDLVAKRTESGLLGTWDLFASPDLFLYPLPFHPRTPTRLLLRP